MEVSPKSFVNMSERLPELRSGETGLVRALPSTECYNKCCHVMLFGLPVLIQPMREELVFTFDLQRRPFCQAIFGMMGVHAHTGQNGRLGEHEKNIFWTMTCEQMGTWGSVLRMLDDSRGEEIHFEHYRRRGLFQNGEVRVNVHPIGHYELRLLIAIAAVRGLFRNCVTPEFETKTTHFPSLDYGTAAQTMRPVYDMHYQYDVKGCLKYSSKRWLDRTHPDYRPHGTPEHAVAQEAFQAALHEYLNYRSGAIIYRGDIVRITPIDHDFVRDHTRLVLETEAYAVFGNEFVPQWFWGEQSMHFAAFGLNESKVLPSLEPVPVSPKPQLPILVPVQSPQMPQLAMLPGLL